MEMSLDDIIKQNKGKKRVAGGATRGAGGRGRGGRGGRGMTRGGARGMARSNTTFRGRGSFRGARGTGRGGQQQQQIRKPGGGVMRGRGRGGIVRRPNNPTFNRPRPVSGVKRQAFLGAAANGAVRKFGTDATKLIVSNLDFGVTDSDILELFGEFGVLKSAGVHYDRSGRSLGSADLIFDRRADAIKAMKQYNGVPLDGREMNIQLATSDITANRPLRGGVSPARGGARVGTTFKPRGGAVRGNFRQGGNFKPRGATRGNFKPRGATRGSFKPRGNTRGAGGRGARGGRGRGGKPGGRGAPKKPPTAEELDAELEAYVKSKVSSSDGA